MRAFQHHRPVTGPCIPMSVVICSWTGSRVGFSIFTCSSTKPSSVRPQVLLTIEWSLLPPSSLSFFPVACLRLNPRHRRALHEATHPTRLYTRERPKKPTRLWVLFSRSRQPGAGAGASVSASLLLGDDRKHCLFPNASNPFSPLSSLPFPSPDPPRTHRMKVDEQPRDS